MKSKLILAAVAAALVLATPSISQAADTVLGTVTSAGASVNNGSTAVPFSVPRGVPLAVQCDATAYAIASSAGSGAAVSSSTGLTALANQLLPLGPPDGSINAVAVQSVSGTANCKVIQVFGANTFNPTAAIDLLGADLNVNSCSVANGITGQTITSNGALKAGAGSANYVQVTGGAVGVNPIIATAGSDANRGLLLEGQGTGNIYLAAQMANYVQVAGAATSASPAIVAQGADTNVSLALQGKGTGGVAVGSQNANYLFMQGFGAGNAPALSSVGSDANIGLNLQGKGTGTVWLGANNANFFQFAGAGAGSPPAMILAGSDTNIGINIVPKGTGKLQVSGDVVPAVAPTTTGANVLMAYGSVTLSAGAFSGAFSTAFSTTPVFCTCTDQTAVAAVKCTANATTLTVAGTGTDAITWMCFGPR